MGTRYVFQRAGVDAATIRRNSHRLGKPIVKGTVNSRQVATAANVALDAVSLGLDYQKFRKNRYGRGPAFTTAATYAGVGLGSAAVASRATKAMHLKGKTGFAATLAIGAGTSFAGNKVISSRVERHFDPKNRKRAKVRTGPAVQRPRRKR